MAVNEFIFALACAALISSMAYLVLGLGFRYETEKRSPRTHVLYRARPWRSIELYPSVGGTKAATLCCPHVHAGDILVLPEAHRLAYRVEAIEYVGRYGATARLRAMSTDGVLASGLLHDPIVVRALAEPWTA